LKRFFDDLLAQGIEELEVNEYFNPPGRNESRQDPEVSGEDSVEMAKVFTPILCESMATKAQAPTEFRFQLFEEECDLP
jgi:hypothetical protein